MKKMIVSTVGILILAASPTLSARAGDLGEGPDGHGPLAAPAVQKPAPATLSERFGTWFVPAPVLMLDAMDHGALIAADEATPGPAPLRFGVERAVQLSLADGQWINVDGGRLWRVDIEAAGALNSRLHLSGLNMLPGQELALVCPDQEQQMGGLLELNGEFGNGEAFGLFSPSARTQIQWFVPTGQPAKELPFDAVAYSYGYRQVLIAPSNGGTCSLDPICYPTWANESNAAAKITWTSGGGSYLCSGQLTATTAADETPYFSTANHCINTTAEANACQFIFFYRSNTCGAGTSAGTTVSGGADLSSTYLASDCTLLMIKGTLPAGVAWDGWLTTNPAVNTTAVGLHHPSGTPQAISFGVKNVATFNCGSPTSNWNSISWNNGITEGGSSGSAIFRESDRKMFGVLTCGASACNNTAGDDGYGRWDLAVAAAGSNFANLLAAGADDAQDQNDTCATAKALSAGTYTGLVVKRLDEDWYALPVPIGSTLTVSMTFTHSNGDVDVQLFSECGGAVTLNRNANTNNESFTYVNNTASGTVYMRVYLATDTRNDYSLTFSTSVAVPANDNCGTATAVNPGAFSFNSTNATNAPLALPSSCDEGAGIAIVKDLWYRFTAPTTGRATATTCGAAAFDTRIAVYPGASCPTTSPVTACSDNAAGCASGTSTATWQVTAGSVWYVRVGGATTGGTGTLTLSLGSNCAADLNNNGNVAGDDLGIMLSYWGVGGPADLNSDGITNGADLGVLLAAWGACP